MRVYQYAEEVKLSNRVLVQLLQDRGVDITSHMAPLTEQDEETLREIVHEIRKDSPAPQLVVEVEDILEPIPEIEEVAVAEDGPDTRDEPRALAEEPLPPERHREGVEADATETPPPAPTEDLSSLVDKPAKPAGRRVKKIQEREVIEQSLQELEEERVPGAPGAPEKKKTKEEVPARPGPDKTRTYRFHKRGGPRTLRRKSRGPQEPTIPLGPVEIHLPISVKDFSQALGVKVADLLRVLMQNGVRANINARLDRDTVDVLALEFGREVKLTEQVAAEDAFLSDLEDAEDMPEDLTPRAPIVAMLGHVDHGKTSLLDYIRKSDVAAKEAGGITQHISSYKITTESGREIVFIDLPGHEAFTNMRGRGAQATDIVILVVAAEEGVKPQTEESINHAKAAEVPVIVALTKIDKPEANPMRVKQELTSFNLIAEEWGGETLMVETSATTGLGIPELLEAISLQAEVMELKANAHKKSLGVVLEAEKSEGRGVLATILVQEGTLRPGDVVVAGTGIGRVRDIRNDQGVSIPMAGPSTPVEISGLSAVPEAGDKFYVVENLARAKDIAAERTRRLREDSLAEKSALSLADLFRRAGETETSEVPIIVKADTKGSVEAISAKLEGLANPEVKIKILHAAVGTVNESDVQLASASKAIILGFDVFAEDRARALANERGVDIRHYSIIYELIDDVKQAMEVQLAPEEREVVIGHAEVRKVFPSSKLGNIAGSYVTDGVIRRNGRARLIRAGKVIHDRSWVESLKRIRDDAKEVRDGFECGIRLKNFNDVVEGDIVECYEVQEIRRTLEDAANTGE